MYKIKKAYVVFTLLASCFLMLSACSSKNMVEKHLYKNNKWDSTKEQITKKEGREPDEVKTGENQVLQYRDVDYFDHKGTIEYILENNKLQEVFFDISFSEDDDMDKIKENFREILSAMVAQYGETSLEASVVRKDDGFETLENIDYDLEKPFGYSVQWYNKEEKDRERLISLTFRGEIRMITIGYAKINK